MAVVDRKSIGNKKEQVIAITGVDVCCKVPSMSAPPATRETVAANSCSSVKPS